MKRSYEACESVAATHLGMAIAEETVITAATAPGTAQLPSDDPTTQRGCLCKPKSSNLKFSDVKKALKASKGKSPACSECVRAANKAAVSTSDANGNGELSLLDDAAWICASCAVVLCEKDDGTGHLEQHAAATRTNGRHNFAYNFEKQYLWCCDCKSQLKPLDDGNKDIVKSFLDEIRSFQKQVADKRAKKDGSTEPTDSLSSSVAEVVITSPSKPSSDGDESSRSPPRKQLCSPQRTPGVKGLSNLGNTCFYNSVMQCMMHTHALYRWQELVIDKDCLMIKPGTVTVNEKKVEVNAATIPVDTMAMPLVNALQHFLTEYRTGKSPNPAPLFSQISQNAPRFRGWAQQDAHELLRYLLDGMRTEELKRFKQGVEAFLKISGKPDSEQVLKIKAILESTDRCYVDSIFGGSLLQVICCQSCQHVSNSLEPFLDLSLPLNYDAITPPAPIVAPRNRREGTPSKHQKKKARKEAERTARKARKVQFAKLPNEQSDDVPEEPRPSDAKNGDVKGVADATNELDDIKPIDADASDAESQQSEYMSTSEDEEGPNDPCSPKPEANGNVSNGSTSYSAILATPATSLPAVEATTRSLVNSLKQFTAIENLCESNAYECENCCAPYNKKLSANSKDKKTVEATKRYLIYSPPAVLTLHLKRFEQVPFFGNRMRAKKIRGHVDFPHVLDLAPFCSKSGQRMAPGQDRVIYSLYGIVSHSGDLGGGHYVAYVKARRPLEPLTQFMDAGLTPDRLVASFEEYRAETAITQRLLKPEMPVEEILQRLDENSQWHYCSDSHTRSVDLSEIDHVEAYILFYERIY